ncbi:hypothetical protein FQN54_005007 [Arachnomyces sp. PD_36]|nr:hypothetical protein FQN54_005007 [Arachnomyces sp. PD_36]
MHSPSPQLLRALRSSISTSIPTRATYASTFTNTRSALTTTKPSPSIPKYPSHHHHRTQTHPFTTTTPHPSQSHYKTRTATTKPSTLDRGPTSTESTQTDFSALDVLGAVAAPTTAIDACLDDGFHLDNGVRVTGGDGCILVGGEVFAWRPWEGGEGKGRGKEGMINKKGQWEVGEEVWGVLGLVWPRPDILILGLGASVYPISMETRRHINSLGIRIEVQDTRNAAAQFNLLATERGVQEVAAAMIPVGWEGRRP